MNEPVLPSNVDKMVSWIAFAMTLKAQMLEDGARSHVGACPFCSQGNVVAAVAVNKHIVIGCSTPGCVQVRE